MVNSINMERSEKLGPLNPIYHIPISWDRSCHTKAINSQDLDKPFILVNAGGIRDPPEAEAVGREGNQAQEWPWQWDARGTF